MDMDSDGCLPVNQLCEKCSQILLKLDKQCCDYLDNRPATAAIPLAELGEEILVRLFHDMEWKEHIGVLRGAYPNYQVLLESIDPECHFCIVMHDRSSPRSMIYRDDPVSFRVQAVYEREIHSGDGVGDYTPTGRCLRGEIFLEPWDEFVLSRKLYTQSSERSDPTSIYLGYFYRLMDHTCSPECQSPDWWTAAHHHSCSCENVDPDFDLHNHPRERLARNSDTTSSRATMVLLRNWLACTVKHAIDSLTPQKIRPTRLLKIGDIQDKSIPVVRLVPGEDTNSSLATLSYCWGENHPLKLCRDNYEAIATAGLLLTELPLTFQHAVSVCQALDIFMDRLLVHYSRI